MLSTLQLSVLAVVVLVIAYVAYKRWRGEPVPVIDNVTRYVIAPYADHIPAGLTLVGDVYLVYPIENDAYMSKHFQTAPVDKNSKVATAAIVQATDDQLKNVKSELFTVSDMTHKTGREQSVVFLGVLADPKATTPFSEHSVQGKTIVLTDLVHLDDPTALFLEPKQDGAIVISQVNPDKKPANVRYAWSL